MQQFTFIVYLNDERLAELDRLGREVSTGIATPASREEMAAVCVVKYLDKCLEHRKELWLGKQRWLEGLARKHGFRLSKDMPVEQ